MSWQFRIVIWPKSVPISIVFLGIVVIFIGLMPAASAQPQPPVAVLIRTIPPKKLQADKSSQPCDNPFVLALSNNGELLASGNQRTSSTRNDIGCGTVAIWKLPTTVLQTEMKATEHYGVVSQLAFSRDGHQLISGACIYNDDDSTDSVIQSWDTKSGGSRWRQEFKGKRLLSLVMLSMPNTLMIALGKAESRQIIFLDPNSGQLLRDRNINHGVTNVAMTPDGTLLISTGDDRTVRIWNTATWQVVQQFSVECPHCNIGVSPKMSEPLVAVTDGKWQTDVTIWNYRKGERLRTIKGQVNSAGALAFSPNGRLLLVGGSIYVATGDPGHSCPPLEDTEPAVRVWDIQTGRLVCVTVKDQGENRGLVFLSDSVFCTSDMESGAIQIWQLPKINEKNEGDPDCKLSRPPGNLISNESRLQQRIGGGCL